MPKDFPAFSVRKITSIEGYERFYHCRAYLAQRSALFRGAEADRWLMSRVGFAKLPKFLRRRPAWDCLARPVPLAYLAAINARLDVLDCAVAADREEFEQTLALPLCPRWVIRRLMPAIYNTLELPEGISEEAAITLILEESRRSTFKHCINYPGLKSIYVEPDGQVETVVYPPVLRAHGGFLIPTRGGNAIGTCRIG